MVGENMEEYILLIYEKDSSQYILDGRILPLSGFLCEMDVQRHADPRCILTVTLPTFLQISPKYCELITCFYAGHHYQPQLIKVQQLKTSNYEKSMDGQSLNFLNNWLKPLTGEEIKGLLNLAQYLKLNHLKDVICLLLASRYFFNYNEIEMKRRLADCRIEYSRQQEIDLARKSWGYARQMSIELLEKLTQMEDSKHRK